jgi:hypothetical protein
MCHESSGCLFNFFRAAKGCFAAVADILNCCKYVFNMPYEASFFPTTFCDVSKCIRRLRHGINRKFTPVIKCLIKARVKVTLYSCANIFCLIS